MSDSQLLIVPSSLSHGVIYGVVNSFCGLGIRQLRHLLPRLGSTPASPSPELSDPSVTPEATVLAPWSTSKALIALCLLVSSPRLLIRPYLFSIQKKIMPNITLHIKTAKGPTQVIKEHLIVTLSNHEGGTKGFTWCDAEPAGTVTFNLEETKCTQGVKFMVFCAVTRK